MTDGQLVLKARSGEAAAYQSLVSRWAARILAVCHARVGRAAAAEDLAQEALLRGWRGIGTLAEPEKFGAWICGIASRACLDWLKSSQRTEVSLSGGNGEMTWASAAPTAAQRLERKDEINRLMHEVERLPEALREAVMLYYYEDCTYADLARRLGVSAATINARLTQARLRLRERLGAAREVNVK